MLEEATAWVGSFDQNGRNTDMTFEDLYIGEKPTVYGVGADTYGEFTLQGLRDGDYVSFRKHYNSLDLIIKALN